jgi:hypothetical protein
MSFKLTFFLKIGLNSYVTCSIKVCMYVGNTKYVQPPQPEKYKEAITFKWNTTFQLVPPDMHCHNWAERTICTFKDHFLAILVGVNVAFLLYLWDLFLPQAELTLNCLQQAMLNPLISAWKFF